MQVGGAAVIKGVQELTAELGLKEEPRHVGLKGKQTELGYRSRSWIGSV
jgi:hypothetical protein